MIEIIPDIVDTAFFYFHTRRSSGDEIAPFVEEFRQELPHTFIWAGDGCIEGRLDGPLPSPGLARGAVRSPARRLRRAGGSDDAPRSAVHPDRIVLNWY